MTRKFFHVLISCSIISISIHGVGRDSIAHALTLDEHAERISPARKIHHNRDRQKTSRSTISEHSAADSQIRAIDGTGNNLTTPELGSAHIRLTRLLTARYSDNISSLAGNDRPNPRLISNRIFASNSDTPNPHGASDFLWQWGQFLDHDIDLTDGVDPEEAANIIIPDDDEWFTPASQIPFNRSIYDISTGIDSPRQQINEITAWIDASNVYGSDEARALELRTLNGDGKLKTSEGNLLPFNINGLPNAGGDSPSLFLAGDVRANEQLGLTVMHTLFVREHNRLVDRYQERHPEWSGDQLYEKARKIVGAQMQVITYKEFLPALLGGDSLSAYSGYQPDIDPNVSNAFSTAAYRFGHSALSPQILRLNATGEMVPEGHLPLRNAFFSPWRLAAEGGLEPILRGLASQQCQKIDAFVVDDIRNFLFGEPQAGGFDLVSLNIQRGRDHGLPSYNEARLELGLEPANGFADISSDPDVQRRLAAAYTDVNAIDLWVGGLAEDALPTSHLGLVFSILIKEQFEALRDGDRFWYQRSLEGKELREVEQTTLAKIIRRNTKVTTEIPDNVFFVSSDGGYESSRKNRRHSEKKRR